MTQSKGHPHAALMLEYAKDADPSKRWERVSPPSVAPVMDAKQWILTAHAELDGINVEDDNGCLKAAKSALEKAVAIIEAEAHARALIAVSGGEV